MKKRQEKSSAGRRGETDEARDEVLLANAAELVFASVRKPVISDLMSAYLQDKRDIRQTDMRQTNKQNKPTYIDTLSL